MVHVFVLNVQYGRQLMQSSDEDSQSWANHTPIQKGARNNATQFANRHKKTKRRRRTDYLRKKKNQ